MNKWFAHLGTAAMFWLNLLPPYLAYRILHITPIAPDTATIIYSILFATSLIITLLSVYYLQPEKYTVPRKCFNTLIGTAFVAMFALPFGVWSAGLMWGLRG